MKQKTDVGVVVPFPEKPCGDRHCPFHGYATLRGRIFTGEAVKDVFHSTVAIQFTRQRFIPKFERYEKRRTRIRAHVPPCFSVKKGDVIRIMETRPISKTKNFVAIEVVKK